MSPSTATSVEAFYHDYNTAYDTIIEDLQSRNTDGQPQFADQYAHTLLNRLLAIRFLETTDWFTQQNNLLEWYHDEYINSEQPGRFHEHWLNPLFFNAINPVHESTEIPPSTESVVTELPTLTGGLFNPHAVDKHNIYLPDETLASIINNFLTQYEFTTTPTQDDAINPRVLGKVHESILTDQEREVSGVFYTPRKEVDLMCRMAVFEQLDQQLPKLPSQTLHHLVYANPWNFSANAFPYIEEVKQILDDLTVVDPACGAGAFLIGMQHVLIELQEKTGRQLGYTAKHDLITDHLFGVDIKEWAVRIAEFRLWLTTIDDTEPTGPLSLDFSDNLAIGDSIVQEIAGTSINTAEITHDTDLETYLNKQIAELQQSQANLGSFLGDEPNSTTTGADQKTQARVEQLKATRERVSTGNEDVFIWTQTFQHVFENGGFDVVIGNPPYVSSDDIIDPNIPEHVHETFDDDTVAELQAEYQESLQTYAETVNGIDTLSGKSDLYIYFYLRALELLNETGTLAFLTSNSWLDTGFGESLKKHILRERSLKHVISNDVQRSFEDADVNTEITVINNDSPNTLDGTVKFTSLTQPYEELQKRSTIWHILYSHHDHDTIHYNTEPIQILERETYRSILVPEASLWALGGTGQLGVNTYQDTDDITPGGDWAINPKWGVFIRAPTLYFTQINPTLETSLNAVSDVHLGLTSGQNSYFYLDPTDVKEHQIEDEYLTALIKSPSEITRYQLTTDDITKSVLNVQTPLNELPDDSNIKQYLLLGIEQGVPDGSFFDDTTGDEWYMKTMFNGDLVQPYNVGKRHFTAINETDACVDKRLVCIDTESDHDKWVLWAFLNSTLGVLIKELYGRSSLGQGALENSVVDTAAMPTINPNEISETVVKRITQIANEHDDTTIGSVFEEIADHHKVLQISGVTPFRRDIDEIIMGDVLDLSLEEQQVIYETVVRLVRNRVTKAQSVN